MLLVAFCLMLLVFVLLHRRMLRMLLSFVFFVLVLVGLLVFLVLLRCLRLGLGCLFLLALSRKRIVMLESQVHTLCRQFDILEEDMARINERLAIMDGDVKLPQLFDDPDDDFNKYGEGVK